MTDARSRRGPGADLTGRTRIWVDFENAPHVLVLAPIVDRLREAGFSEFLFTARDFSYTVALARQLGFPVRVTGLRGPGHNGFERAGRILWRAADLSWRLRGERSGIGLALSHGSRSQMLAARVLGIPSIALDDYEASFQGFYRLAHRLLVPSVIPREAWGRPASKVLHYQGLKEEIYLNGWTPTNNPPDVVARNSHKVLILLRPEAMFSHYHSSLSQLLQDRILERLSVTEGVLVVLLPRDPKQAEFLAAYFDGHGIDYFVPDKALDGPHLISLMDVVIGGGGTMTREAAVLGVPSYSFFSGTWGAVDHYLVSQGRLNRIATPDDVARVRFAKRTTSLAQVGDHAVRSVSALVEGYAREFVEQ